MIEFDWRYLGVGLLFGLLAAAFLKWLEVIVEVEREYRRIFGR